MLTLGSAPLGDTPLGTEPDQNVLSPATAVIVLNGVRGNSAVGSLTTLSIPAASPVISVAPSAPLNLTGTMSGTSVALAWSASTQGTNVQYQVQYRLAATIPTPVPTPTPSVSPSGTEVVDTTGVIIDNFGNRWTLVLIRPLLGLQIAKNGTVDNTTSDVVILLWYQGAIYYETNGLGQPTVPTPVPVPVPTPVPVPVPVPVPTPVPTIPAVFFITPGTGAFNDSQGNLYTLDSAGNAIENGTPITGGAGTSEMAYYNQTVYAQDGATGAWYTWDGTAFNPAAAPHGAPTTPVPVPVPTPSPTPSPNPTPAPTPTSGTGQFSIRNGRIYDPNGALFVSKGINVYDALMGNASTNNSAQPLTSLFPGINQVRLNVFVANEGTSSQVYPNPSNYLTFVQQLTGYTRNGDGSWSKTSNQNIVVEIEDHNQGSSYQSLDPFTGTALTIQLNWYTAMAQYFNGNPYVWFGGPNEIGSASFAAADIRPASVWESQIYNAIRGTGNSNIIQFMAGVGGSDLGTVGVGSGYDPSLYAGMTNIVWEIHCYMTGDQADPYTGAYYSNAAGYVAGGTSIPDSGAGGGWGIIGAQTIRSADGLVPVVIGEWGPDGDGGNPGTTEAAPLAAVIQAVQAQGVGATAWGYYPAGNDNGNWDLVNGGYSGSPSLTTWGVQVAGTL